MNCNLKIVFKYPYNAFKIDNHNDNYYFFYNLSKNKIILII